MGRHAIAPALYRDVAADRVDVMLRHNAELVLRRHQSGPDGRCEWAGCLDPDRRPCTPRCQAERALRLAVGGPPRPSRSEYVLEVDEPVLFSHPGSLGLEPAVPDEQATMVLPRYSGNYL